MTVDLAYGMSACAVRLPQIIHRRPNCS